MTIIYIMATAPVEPIVPFEASAIARPVAIDSATYAREPYMLLIRVLTYSPFITRFIIGYTNRSPTNRVKKTLSVHPLERELAMWNNHLTFVDLSNARDNETFYKYENLIRIRLMNRVAAEELVHDTAPVLWSEMDLVLDRVSVKAIVERGGSANPGKATFQSCHHNLNWCSRSRRRAQPFVWRFDEWVRAGEWGDFRSSTFSRGVFT
jgi:hypothetical protein